MSIETSIQRRNRRADFVEQGAGSVLGGPAMDVVPVESIVAEDGDHVSNVDRVFAPLAKLFPSQFGHDHILGGRNENLTPQAFIEDQFPPLETRLIVRVVAEVENLDLEWYRRDGEDIAESASDSLEGS